MAIKLLVLGTAHGHVFGMTEHALEVPGTELVGVYDDDADRLAASAEKLNAKPFADLDVALREGPALCLIGAVPGDRAALAKRAAEAGAKVLSDKPIALTHAVLDDLMASLADKPQPLTVFYPYRGTPLVRAAKAVLDSGKIGKLVRVMSCGPHVLRAAGRPAWHFTRAGNGGAVIDIGSHHLDAACWLAGAAPEYICSTHTNLSQPGHAEFQDFSQTQLRFPGGVLGHVEVDWLNPESMKHFGDTRMWLQGTTGKVELRMGDEVSSEVWTHDKPGRALDTSGYEDSAAWAVRLVDDVLNDRPCDVPQEDVWRASRATLYAYESAEAGGKAMTNLKW